MLAVPGPIHSSVTHVGSAQSVTNRTLSRFGLLTGSKNDAEFSVSRSIDSRPVQRVDVLSGGADSALSPLRGVDAALRDKKTSVVTYGDPPR